MFGCCLSLRQEPRLELTIAQKLAIAQEQELGLRIQLLQTLKDRNYEPTGVCPDCGYKLKPIEVLQGFNRDPCDYTTKCPKCGMRFPALLVAKDVIGSIEYPFYCADQTLAQLKDLDIVPEPEIFERDKGALYHSAIVHFGTVTAALTKLDRKYDFSKKEKLKKQDWKDKVESFLGKMPDAHIADAVGVSGVTISNLRRNKGIQRYNRNKRMKEIE